MEVGDGDAGEAAKATPKGRKRKAPEGEAAAGRKGRGGATAGGEAGPSGAGGGAAGTASGAGGGAVPGEGEGGGKEAGAKAKKPRREKAQPIEPYDATGTDPEVGGWGKGWMEGGEGVFFLSNGALVVMKGLGRQLYQHP